MLVYFAQCGDAVKIGRSQNPVSKIKQLNKNALTPLELLLVTSKYTEKQLYRKFKQYRKNSEWFDLSTEINAFIAAEKSDPMNNVNVTPIADTLVNVLRCLRDLNSMIQKKKIYSVEIGDLVTLYTTKYGDVSQQSMYRHLRTLQLEEYIHKTTAIAKLYIATPSKNVIGSIYVIDANEKVIPPDKVPEIFALESGEKSLIFYEITPKGYETINE